MQQTTPTISVIMSVHNGEAYLKEAVDSILAQSYSNFEFLIANDGSTDSTAEILNQYKDDKRVVIITQKNTGLTKTLNTLIRLTKGAYIARMDADDVALPNRLQQQLSFLKENSYDLIGANCDIIDQSGKVIKKKQITLPSDQSELKRLVFITNRFTHSTWFGKRKLFEELYNETFLKTQDYEFLLRLLGKGYHIGHMEESVLKYRFHNASISTKTARKQEWLSLKARWLALTKYNYSLTFLPLFLKAFLIFLIPPKVKYFIVYKLR